MHLRKHYVHSFDNFTNHVSAIPFLHYSDLGDICIACYTNRLERFFFASLNESVLVISISQEIHISFMIISQCNKNTALPNYRVLCDVLSSEFRFLNVFTALINGLLFCLDLSGAEGLYINNIKSITTNFVYLNDFFSQVTEIYSIKTKTIKIQ